jgi:two-component system, chemotaxis family, CheB/CheR fusion protein
MVSTQGVTPASLAIAGLLGAEAWHEADSADGLLSDLGGRGGLVFEDYQRDSLLRRIRGRMATLGLDRFASYRTYLQTEPGEYRRLCDAVPVHRTEFFRDPNLWASLSAELAPTALGGGAVRGWSAGCATGEEAYSLAIVLAELMGPEAYRQRVVIFATDVSAAAVATARAGRFSARRMETMPLWLRDAYFQRDGGDWAVRPGLRAKVVFGVHDLLRDPPIGRLDVITCRNTLIYFTRDAQVRALARLYLGLREDGLLFAGQSENPQRGAEFFRPVGDVPKIYRAALGQTRQALELLARRRGGRGCRRA